jgi:hypothetical protein
MMIRLPGRRTTDHDWIVCTVCRMQKPVNRLRHVLLVGIDHTCNHEWGDNTCDWLEPDPSPTSPRRGSRPTA